jgi:phosphoribosylaminoimidazolecarboxamide formyltransferase/IMP cyclohydrolase
LKQGFRLLASGGTAKKLAEAGINVHDVSKLIGTVALTKIFANEEMVKRLTAAGITKDELAELVVSEAILGHRVVTLSPEVHAGLLAQYDVDVAEMEALGVPYIDLACVDLYPLKAEIMREGSTLESVIEMTDIGGPCMLRSAAKGRRIVISKPEQRQEVLDWLQAGEPDRDTFIGKLCAEAEGVVAEYVLTSARRISDGDIDGIVGCKLWDLCYGENKIQKPAALYVTDTDDPLAIGRFVQIAGSAPSYCNVADIDRGVTTLTHIAAVFARVGVKRYTSLVMKHGNVCGAGCDNSLLAATRKMIEGDELAMFGGTIMLNFPVDKAIAELLLHHDMPEGKKRLIDCVVAPEISPEAVEMLRRRNDKCRMFVNPALAEMGLTSMDVAPIYRPVRGGFLIQPNYHLPPMISKEMVKCGSLDTETFNDLYFAWAICSTSNSNTVTIVKDGMLLGNGVGQQARVYGSQLAVERSQGRAAGAVAWSDSFFPATDGVEVLINSGVATIFASSGSLHDDEVIGCCREAGITLVMAPDEEARGFFRH